MMNIRLAELIVQKLAGFGIRSFCLCPGGRAAPFVEVLSRAAGIETLRFYEERSACFFALGRARRDSRPAAVITTSGTAAAELLPGALEGFYSGLPLALVTSDRPASQAQSGCPQTLESAADIFKSCAALSAHIARPEDIKAFQGWRPCEGSLHLNTAFEEPLLDGRPRRLVFSERFFQNPPDIYPFPDWEKPPSKASRPARKPAGKPPRLRQKAAPAARRPPARLKNPDEIAAAAKKFFNSCKRPLVIAGELRKEETAPVQNFLKGFGGLLFAEPLSGLCRMPERLLSGEAILRAAFQKKEADGVLRLGGVPRARFWRDLEKAPWPVLSLSSPPFYPGIARESLNFPLLAGLPFVQEEMARLGRKAAPPEALAPEKAPAAGRRKAGAGQKSAAAFRRPGESAKKGGGSAAASRKNPKKALSPFKKYDRSQYEKWRRILRRYPAAEPAWIARMKESLPARSRVFLGNSLPIRLWGAAPPPSEKALAVTGQGGVNGIDGLVSRFLGECRPGSRNIAILGDLSLLYDMAGFWPAAEAPSWTAAVINNFGGRIFSRLYKNPDFLNEHSLSFEGLAKIWGLGYRLFKQPSEFFWPDASGRPFLLEIQPDQAQTEACFKAAGLLWKG